MNLSKKISPIFLYLLLFSFFFLLSAQAAEPVKKKTASPIQIEADHMISDQKNNSVFFSGKVEAAQDDVVIHADEMTVFYINKEKNKDSEKEPASGGSKNIKRLWAVGNVEITREEWVATGDSADYFEIERKIILTGNTKVWQDNNLVTGDKFIMFLDEEKSIVESNAENNERVKAFFYPK
jgi:lipopolysaccharide export system protein LptA